MRRGKRRREMPPGELMLAAMVDMMMNLLIFLITLYGTDPIDLRPSNELVLPRAATGVPIEGAVVVEVTAKSIAVEGRPVVTLTDGMVPAGGYAALAAALTAERGKVTDVDAEPELSIQCDRRVPWSVLGPIVTVAGRSGFPEFRFIVRGD